MAILDATEADDLIAGDVWVWSYTTDDDVSSWANPIVTIREGRSPSATLVASSDDTEKPIELDGGYAGTIPATDFDAGVFAWFVDVDQTTGLGDLNVWVEVEVEVDGVPTTVFSRDYTVRPEVAVRGGGS